MKSYFGTTRYYIEDLKPAIGAHKKVSKYVIEVRHMLGVWPLIFLSHLHDIWHTHMSN